MKSTFIENQVLTSEAITKKMKRSKFFRQAGMSEMGVMITILVLVIIAAVALANWPNIEYRYKKYKFNSQLALLQQGMLDYKGADTSFAGATIANMCANNVVKGELCTSAVTPWGGAWTTGPDTDTSKLSITADVKDAKTATNLKRDMDRVDGWTNTLTGTSVKMVR